MIPTETLVSELEKGGILKQVEGGTFLPREGNWSVGVRGESTYFLLGQEKNRITASLRTLADWENQLTAVAWQLIIPEGVSIEDEATRSRLSGICLYLIPLRRQPITFHWLDRLQTEESYGEFSFNLLPAERKKYRIERLNLWLPLQPLFSNNSLFAHPPETPRVLIV